MNQSPLPALVIAAALAICLPFAVISQQSTPAPPAVASDVRYQYATARFMEQRSAIFWPDGTVQNINEATGNKKFPGGEPFPKGADYRMYILTAALNIMGAQGYELVHMDGSDVVTRRTVTR